MTATMPRDGEHAHNGPFEEEGHNIAHGVGKVDPGRPLTRMDQTTKVDRADKTATMPEGLKEQGAGLPGMNASGGQSQGIKQGDNVGQGGRGSSN
ncbi:allantoicase [Purpureocillium lavendulum]|uniref:Allantoicase n=1 Tax=Purpureocillium lavendulum TaxID=1247861 RepID=A0AB34FXI0_9HYPO|nr:allantoicase [Purpureocillium lavendulum]